MKRTPAVENVRDLKMILEDPNLENAFKENRTPRCLPAEVLLSIVHCVDFNTLVALSFTSHAFHSVVQTNAGVLAKRLRAVLIITDNKVVIYDEETTLELDCDISMPSTYVAAMTRVASHVGFHNIATLNVTDDWRCLPMDRLFYASPVIRYVETLVISVAASKRWGVKSVDDVNQLAEQFPRLRRVVLHADNGPARFDCRAFLLTEGARKLPELFVVHPCSIRRSDGSTSEPMEYDFLEYCVDCSRLAEGVGRFVQLPDSPQTAVSHSFLVTALRRLAKADRTITVQFGMAEEPNLSTVEFSVHQMEQYGRTITHYKSRNSSVSVYKLHGFFTVTNDPSFDPFSIP